MGDQTEAFHAFEQAGWGNAELADSYDRHMSVLTRQSVQALLDAARGDQRSRVLDVATGAGYVAGAAAGRGAAATGVDFSPAQVTLARGRYPGVGFQEADAEALPFEHGSVDAWTCAFGMCHFPHPEAALREASRVLVPGGRIAFTVWEAPARCAGFAIFYGAMRELGSMEVDVPAGPDFFLFSDAGRCVSALTEAGFGDARVATVPQSWRLPDADALFRIMAEATVRAAAVLKAQSPAARAAIREAMRERLAPYARTDGQVDLPMPAVLASAVKPA